MAVKITITMDLDDGYAEPDHKMGISEAGFTALLDALDRFGTNIDVAKAGSDG